MKIKTTKKEIINTYPTVVAVGYCRLQTTLQSFTPFAYTTRREGWGADVYKIAPGVALTTGYASFGNVTISYEQSQKIELEAEKILTDFSISPKKQTAQIKQHLAQFIESIK